MVLTEEMYAADGRGVYLTTTTEVRKRMAGDKPGAWQTLTLATLSPMNEAKEVQVVLKEKVDDGVKRTLRRLWLSALGREVLPIGTDTDATVKTKELVVRIEKKWTDNKRWSEVKRSPMKATQELRKMPGYVDTYNARVGDQNVTVMLRVKATEVRSFLKERGERSRRKRITPVSRLLRLQFCGCRRMTHLVSRRRKRLRAALGLYSMSMV